MAGGGPEPTRQARDLGPGQGGVCPGDGNGAGALAGAAHGAAGRGRHDTGMSKRGVLEPCKQVQTEALSRVCLFALEPRATAPGAAWRPGSALTASFEIPQRRLS